MNKERAVIPCQTCGLQFQCICSDIPKLNSDIELSLLMHENEYSRDTNTGRWLLQSLPRCHDYSWSRIEVNQALQQRLDDPDCLSLLVYPSDESVPLEDALLSAQKHSKKPHFIVLDGTWQEAKKMERKSPWLDNIQRVHLTPQQPSNYQLRRNQGDGHLCTLEVVSEILRALKEPQHANALNAFLAHLTKVFQADKSGHAYHQDR